METMKKLLHYLDKMGLKDEKYPLQRRLSLLTNKYKQKLHLDLCACGLEGPDITRSSIYCSGSSYY
ncbi:hypothetical protein ACS0TY_000095 [Phlomoides rotata]